jgi:L-malate glycosyltransferase
MKPERGHRALLRAWAEVERTVPRAWLALVGRGEDEAALRALARELGLARVVFGGYLRGPALVQAYRALDVAVWLREGNDGACRGVLEAMACGVPVVAGDVGAPPELVGETGRVVVPHQPDAIAAALGELLDQEAAARELGRMARERAERYTPRRAADATLAFWRRLRDLPRLPG